MIKKVWGRRRRQESNHNNNEESIHSPHRGKVKGHRKKGVRRKRAATIFLGLSTIMPVASAKLIQPTSANAKSKISVSSSITKKVQEIGRNLIFDKNGNIQLLWLPPSFKNQTAAPVQHSIIKPDDLMPAFSYSDIVYPLSMKYNVDWRLVAAVIQAESGFNPDAVSPVGARGLMQLMPATAADYGLTLESIHDPEANIEAGVRHLEMLSRLYEGDLSLIAAAYNAGQGTVAKFNGVPPFEETQTYVERVLSYYNSFAA